MALQNSRRMVRLDETTHAALADMFAQEGKKWGVLLPVGSLEQHGPLLPFGCDMALARGGAENLAHSLLDDPDYGSLVLPDFAYTPSPGAENTLGTVSTGFDWMGTGLKEIIRSALKTPWAFVGIINGHAHNHGRVIEASMAGAAGLLGPKTPVVIINIYEYTHLSRGSELKPGSHAGEFELALYNYYAHFDPAPDIDLPWREVTARPARIFGLDICPRSVDGVIADAAPDVARALQQSVTLGKSLDNAMLDTLKSNLDIYFAHWARNSIA